MDSETDAAPDVSPGSRYSYKVTPHVTEMSAETAQKQGILLARFGSRRTEVVLPDRGSSPLGMSRESQQRRPASSHPVLEGRFSMVTSCGNKKQLSRNAHQTERAPQDGRKLK